MKMKVLQVHNEYQQRGGEDNVVEFEKALLSRRHEVMQYIVSNHSIASFWSKVRLLWSTHYSIRSYRNFRNILVEEKPDIVHVHNFFPLLSPSVFQACKDEAIPVVMTLHNYRLIHPNGFLLKGDEIDERSVEGSAYQCVKDKVYRNSFLQTLIVAHMIEYHRKRRTWHQLVNRFIALTNFAKAKFVQGGLPADKIHVKPNFLLEADRKPIKHRSNQFVFVGRLSPEKGIKTLLQAWQDVPTYELVIIGEGPLESDVRKASLSNKKITYLGSLSHERVIEELGKSKGLVFPSEWYEGFPMVIVEALACGTPVISSNIGSQQEIITDGISGLHFEVKNAKHLAEKVNELGFNERFFEQLSSNAKVQYENLYNQERNLKLLEEIYERAIHTI
jgi:glycosyltransferase involved in cell wall biosynthesis